MAVYCEVSFPLPVVQSFLYKVPAELKDRIKIGSRVVAPLGSRRLAGYVLEIKFLEKDPQYKVKEIIKIIDSRPPIPEGFVRFAQELAFNSLSSPGLFLEMAEVDGQEEKELIKVALTEKGQVETEQKNFKGKKKEILNLLKDKSLTPNFLKRKLKIKNINSLLNSLRDSGVIEISQKTIRRKASLARPLPQSKQLTLPGITGFRSEPVRQILGKLDQGKSGQFLLFGSFNDRLEVVQSLLENLRFLPSYILLVVPEILQIQKWEPIIEAWKKEIVVMHSQLPERLRREAWQQVISGQRKIILGPRSVLLLPVQPVSLILLDEEQDDLYYQTEGPSFDAREAARIRAEEGGLVIFSSSYPEVSHYWHNRERQTLINLGGEKKVYSTVFFTGEIDQLLEGEVKSEIDNRLISGDRVFFFVQRKGYSSYLYCPGCGFIPRCQNCQIALTFKKEEGLRCRYCGYNTEVPEACPVCGKKLKTGKIRGSQYLEERLSQLFAGQIIARLEEGLDGQQEKKLLSKINAGKIQLIIGTEYALSRLKMGMFSLAVIINPELSLNVPDFRAAHQTYVSMSKVADLLANEEKSKLMVITAMPDHPAIREGARMEYQKFFESEIEYRKLLNYPPFSLLIEINLRSNSIRTSGRLSRLLLEKIAEKFPQVEIIGPKLSRSVWRKSQKEIKFYLRLKNQEMVRELRAFFNNFRIGHPGARISMIIWE
ncbi:MAG: replication restart helicase PriA [Candidatus Saccharicenans sp.]